MFRVTFVNIIVLKDKWDQYRLGKKMLHNLFGSFNFKFLLIWTIFCWGY